MHECINYYKCAAIVVSSRYSDGNFVFIIMHRAPWSRVYMLYAWNEKHLANYAIDLYFACIQYVMRCALPVRQPTHTHTPALSSLQKPHEFDANNFLNEFRCICVFLAIHVCPHEHISPTSISCKMQMHPVFAALNVWRRWTNIFYRMRIFRIACARCCCSQLVFPLFRR